MLNVPFLHHDDHLLFFLYCMDQFVSILIGIRLRMGRYGTDLHHHDNGYDEYHNILHDIQKSLLLQ